MAKKDKNPAHLVWRAELIEKLSKNKKINSTKFKRIQKSIVKSVDYDEPIEVQNARIIQIFKQHSE